MTLDPAALDGSAVLVIESAARERVAARVPLGGPPLGSPLWEGAGAPSEGDGAYASAQYVEARLPFGRFGVEPGHSLEWRLAVERAGRRVEAVPRDGSFRVERPRSDRRLTHWSAT